MKAVWVGVLALLVLLACSLLLLRLSPTERTNAPSDERTEAADTTPTASDTTPTASDTTDIRGTTRAMQASAVTEAAWVSLDGSPASTERVDPVVREIPGGYSIRVRIPGFSKTPWEMEGEVYSAVEIPGWQPLQVAGRPAVPARNIMLSLPADARPVVRLARVSEVSVAPLHIPPAQPPRPDSSDIIPPFEKDTAVYASDALYPQSNLLRVDTGRMRNRHILSVWITPMRVRPATREALVAQEMEIEVLFQPEPDNEPGEVTAPEPEDDGAVEVLPDGFSDGTPSKYMILMDDQWAGNSTLAVFADWKMRKGYDVAQVKTSDIDADGTVTHSQIKSYLQGLAAADYPEYLLIIGNADPTDGVEGYAFSTDIGGYSDLYLSCRTDSDYFPDLACGRLPVETDAQLTTMLTKILGMDRNPPTADMYRKVLVAGQIQDSDDGGDNIADRFFCETLDVAACYFEQDTGGVDYTCTRAIVNPHDVDANCQWDYDSWLWNDGDMIGTRIYNTFVSDSTAQDRINDTINAGACLVYHRDHGSRDRWGDPAYNKYSVRDMLDNGDLLPLVLSINCQTGSYDDYWSFAEAWLTSSDGGAYGVLAAVDTSWSGYNDWYAHGLFAGVLTDYISFQNSSTSPNWPKNLPSPGGSYGSVGSATKLGEMLTFGKMYLEENYGWGDYPEYTFLLHHVFGDPEMEAILKTPAVQSVTHPDELPVSMTPANITVTTGEPGSQVCLYSPGLGGLQLVGETTGTAGAVSFDVVHSNASPIYVTVTRRDRRPYEGLISRPQPIHWDGGGGDSFWSTVTNWSGDVNPTVDDDVTVATNTNLRGTGNYILDLGTVQTYANSLTLDPTWAGGEIAVRGQNAMNIKDGGSITITANYTDNTAAMFSPTTAGNLMFRAAANNGWFTFVNNSAIEVAFVGNATKKALISGRAGDERVYFDGSGDFRMGDNSAMQANLERVWTADTFTGTLTFNNTVDPNLIAASTDIRVLGGTLKIAADEQIGDTVQLAFGGAVAMLLDARGITETAGILADFTSAGADSTIRVDGSTALTFSNYRDGATAQGIDVTGWVEGSSSVTFSALDNTWYDGTIREGEEVGGITIDGGTAYLTTNSVSGGWAVSDGSAALYTAANTVLTNFVTDRVTASAVQTFTVSGSFLEGDVTVESDSDNFVVSLDNSTYSSKTVITVAGSTLASTTVYVKVPAGADTGTLSARLTLSSLNAPTNTVDVSATVDGDTLYWDGAVDGELGNAMNWNPNLASSEFEDCIVNNTNGFGGDGNWIMSLGTGNTVFGSLEFSAAGSGANAGRLGIRAGAGWGGFQVAGDMVFSGSSITNDITLQGSVTNALSYRTLGNYSIINNTSAILKFGELSGFGFYAWQNNYRTLTFGGSGDVEIGSTTIFGDSTVNNTRRLDRFWTDPAFGGTLTIKDGVTVFLGTDLRCQGGTVKIEGTDTIQNDVSLSFGGTGGAEIDISGLFDTMANLNDFSFSNVTLRVDRDTQVQFSQLRLGGGAINIGITGWEEGLSSIVFTNLGATSAFYPYTVADGAVFSNLTVNGSTAYMTAYTNGAVTGWLVSDGSTGDKFAIWANALGLSGDRGADFDGDGLTDYQEYALNGDPKDGLGTITDSIIVNGTGDFLYVYAQRNDDDSIIYNLVDTINLVSGSLATNTYDSSVLGTVVATNYNWVTNTYDTTGMSKEFIKLIVE